MIIMIIIVTIIIIRENTGKDSQLRLNGSFMLMMLCKAA